MNVIFLDFDGVLCTYSCQSDEEIESKIKILADICHEFNCKIVIEASAKIAINEDNMEIESDWVNFIFDMFKKYKIECIGRTPNVCKRYNDYTYTSMWKEDEIRLYLYRHPEIEHYCIIDDDDLQLFNNSDLNKVKEHLVRTLYYSKNGDEEGLCASHKEKIKEILKKENKIRNLVLKRNKCK